MKESGLTLPRATRLEVESSRSCYGGHRGVGAEKNLTRTILDTHHSRLVAHPRQWVTLGGTNVTGVSSTSMRASRESTPITADQFSQECIS